MFASFFVYVYAVGEPNGAGGHTVTGFPALGPVLIWGLWLIGTEALWGRTPGHAITGLKIVSAEGVKPAFGQILKRRLCDVLEISWCFGLIAFLLVRNSPTRQRLGDTVGKIFVVRKDFRPEQFHADEPVAHAGIF